MLPLWYEVRAINSQTTDRSRCFYCNDPAECEDHAIPHSLLKRQNAPRTGYGKDTLPACNECNGLLGSQVFFTLKARKNYLAQRVCQRYAKHLAKSKWEKEELESLSLHLISSALNFNETKERAEIRIGNLGIDPFVPPLLILPTVESKPRVRRRKGKPKRKAKRKRVKAPKTKQTQASPVFVPLYPIAERAGKWIRYASGQWDLDTSWERFRPPLSG